MMYIVTLPLSRYKLLFINVNIITSYVITTVVLTLEHILKRGLTVLLNPKYFNDKISLILFYATHTNIITTDISIIFFNITLLIYGTLRYHNIVSVIIYSVYILINIIFIILV